jgi:hypothetical protein
MGEIQVESTGTNICISLEYLETIKALCEEYDMFTWGFVIPPGLVGEGIFIEHPVNWWYGELTHEFLNKVAPLVPDGQYLQMVDENGGLWRYLFIEGKWIVIHPYVLWVSDVPSYL